jgi:phospholipid/cholesterol/gamma-HCH transport system substrate-binding protein
LLGSKYVNLIPGHAKDVIQAGGKVAKTQEFQSLEDLVGQIIFLATDSAGSDNGSGTGHAPASAAPAATPEATTPAPASAPAAPNSASPMPIPKDAPQ